MESAFSNNEKCSNCKEMHAVRHLFDDIIEFLSEYKGIDFDKFIQDFNAEKENDKILKP